MLTLKVILTDEGQVSVEGPLENKLICIGLLELAKEAVKNYNSSQIIRPVSNELPIR